MGHYMLLQIKGNSSTLENDYTNSKPPWPFLPKKHASKQRKEKRKKQLRIVFWITNKKEEYLLLPALLCLVHLAL